MVERADSAPLNLNQLADTARLAAATVQQLPSGSLLLLAGPLGSGKTTFTRYLAAALGSNAAVSSPTYTLVHEYPTPEGTLVHIDAYRLSDIDELYALGLEEYLQRARLVVIEWGAKLADDFPEAAWLEFDYGAAATQAEDAGQGTAPEDHLPASRLARWRRPPELAASDAGEPGAPR